MINVIEKIFTISSKSSAILEYNKKFSFYISYNVYITLKFTRARGR